MLDVLAKSACRNPLVEEIYACSSAVSFSRGVPLTTCTGSLGDFVDNPHPTPSPYKKVILLIWDGALELAF